jgi:hypothetical protein
MSYTRGRGRVMDGYNMYTMARCMICFLVKESDSDTVIMVIILVVGVGGIFLLFAIMALCYR